MKGIVEKRLGEYMKLAKVSKDTLAKEIGVSSATVDGYLKGNPIPRMRYAKLFNAINLEENVYNQEYESSLREAYTKVLGIMIRRGII